MAKYIKAIGNIDLSQLEDISLPDQTSIIRPLKVSLVAMEEVDLSTLSLEKTEKSQIVSLISNELRTFKRLS